MCAKLAVWFDFTALLYWTHGFESYLRPHRRGLGAGPQCRHLVAEEVRVENDYGYEYERFFSYFTLEELRSHFLKLELEIIWEGNKGSNATNWLQIIGRKSR